ncbi:MAG: hypothetical protein AAFY70_01985 [Bacteroidota bacterium]
MKGLSLYVVFTPQHARNTGKFIKPWTHNKFTTEGQKEKLLASARRYLELHRSKIAFFGVYEHPGNNLLMRWPPAAQSYGMLKLWMKFKPEHSPTLSGTVVQQKYFHHTDGADNFMLELLQKGTIQILNNRVWLVRIYQQPSNTLLFEWSEDRGEIQPGHWLDIMKQDYSV